MGFLDEAAEHVGQRGSICSVRAWLEKQTDVTDADIGHSAQPDVNGITATLRAMKARGFTSNPDTLRRHLRRDCQCPS